MSFWSSARIVLRWLPSRDRGRTPGARAQPELVVLGVRTGCVPSTRPPVRIFVGTELAQHRAERVFVWSIERVRDPSRVYEIHLMKELAGFDRRRWLTGFSNYRFAIPELAGGSGRALYNDVDQIYLCDPAELFDLDLDGHGYLATSPTETSVMLIDCQRMASLWNLHEARSHHRQELVARAAASPGLHGALAPEWNAFDEAYVKNRSKVLHFTQLHTQPWQPLPERFVYQHASYCEPWHELERGADAAGYQLFTREHPSRVFAELTGATPAPEPSTQALLEDDEAALLREDLEGVASVMQLECGRSTPPLPPGGAAHLERATLLSLASAPDASRVDAVVATGGLGRVGTEDAPWIVEALFERARELVWIRLPADDTDTTHDGYSEHASPAGRTRGKRPWRMDRAYWEELLRSTGLRHPDVRWRLSTRGRARFGRAPLVTRAGGRLRAREPRVWVLKSSKGGDTSMSLGLAQELGVPFEIKELRFTALARPHKRKVGRLAASLGPRWLGLDAARSDPLAPPWPDVVVATGWRPAAIAQWIKRASGGRSRLVQMGRKAGQLLERFDVVIACKHFGLPQHPQRIETLMPLNRVTQTVLDEARASWPELFAEARAPRVVLLVGGTTERHRLDSETAWRIGTEVSKFAAEAGGSVHAITSRRTGEKATEALVAGLGYAGRVHRWEPGAADNPYFGYLAKADVLVVTGESESMLAEAAAVGKPLFIYPLPQRSTNLWARLNDWTVYRAHFRPFKKGGEARGKRRHQQGLEYLLAKGLQHGWILPRRDTEQLNQSLVRNGIAHFFGEPLDTSPRAPFYEAAEVAPRVCALLGLPAATHGRTHELTPLPEPRADLPSAPQEARSPGVGSARTPSPLK